MFETIRHTMFQNPRYGRLEPAAPMIPSPGMRHPWIRSCAIGLATLALSLLCGCSGLSRVPVEIDDVFRTTDREVYVFEGDLVEVRLEVFPRDARLAWRFENKSRQELRIFHEHLSLNMANDSENYTLWGAPRRPHYRIPPILLERGKFVSLTYPIKYNSPLWPFKPEGQRWTLNFDVFEAIPGEVRPTGLDGAAKPAPIQRIRLGFDPDPDGEVLDKSGRKDE
ncbi:hypothetical protein SCOR_04315 [Sulfidibacter corallicola]|uniref:Uncharacterized protein n=1 Tax=Sulfidibacter corallicola TaxID=2818388 RepID=A0A8A4TRH5_SULCO|nr:hypothetical protein [Sulfidibacter corallicola]QTD51997.1 hypothetical protein J3U87_05945 [Sulfidibacter corallicola]